MLSFVAGLSADLGTLLVRLWRCLSGRVTGVVVGDRHAWCNGAIFMTVKWLIVFLTFAGCSCCLSANFGCLTLPVLVLIVLPTVSVWRVHVSAYLYRCS